MIQLQHLIHDFRLKTKSEVDKKENKMSFFGTDVDNIGDKTWVLELITYYLGDHNK